MAEPPGLAGADQATTALPMPLGVAVTSIGEPGTVGAGMAQDSLDLAEVPMALTALAVK